MSSIFGFEASRAAQFAIAFAIILVLVALFGLVLRKLTGARLMSSGNDRNRSRQPRLGVVDVYELDRQRQLLLLRRDNVEHLLLIGGPNDVVVETNIVRVAGARIPAASGEGGAERFEPVFEQAPRQVEPSGRPSIETQIAAQLGAFARRPSEESDVDQELSAVASVSAPMQAHPEPVLRPDAVTASSNVQGLRAEARAPAFPGTPPAPEPAPARPEPRPSHTPPPPFQSRPTPVPPAPPAPPAPPTPPAQPAPPSRPEVVRASRPAPAERPAPGGQPAPGAADMSNMAKQLEDALKRPASPVPPPAAAPVPVGSHMAQDEIGDEDDLLEPGPADQRVTTGFNAPLEEEDVVEEPKPAPRFPAAQAEPPRPAVEPVRPAPPPPPPAEAPAASQAPQKASDPFSVEEIEAEFARLLGRPLGAGKKG